MGSLGVRPRRGALGVGSRWATKGVAAACLAAFALALPQGAAAFPCGDGKDPTASTRQLMSIAPDECRTPEKGRPAPQPERVNKTGSMSGLTVFVLAVAGALLIPIGRLGLPHGSDPFRQDDDVEDGSFSR